MKILIVSTVLAICMYVALPAIAEGETTPPSQHSNVKKDNDLIEPIGRECHDGTCKGDGINGWI